MQITGEAGPLFAALAKSQAEFSAVTRDRVNPQFKSRYATLDGIREMALPILAANGLSVIQWPSTDRTDGVITVRAHILLAHSSGAMFQPDDLSIPLADNKANSVAQQIGVAATYGARYQFRDVLGICGTDDTDTDAEPVRTAPPPRVVAVPAMDAPDAVAIAQVQALWAGCQSKTAAVEVGMALSKQGRAADHPVSVASKAAREAALARLNHG